MRLWPPASVLVIVILPDLLARSWRQESPCLPSTSASQLPPTPRIIQTSCCKVPCLLPPTIFTLASSIVLDLKKSKTLRAFLAASWSLHGVSPVCHGSLRTGPVPVLQHVGAESGINVAMWKQGLFFFAPRFLPFHQCHRISPVPREDPALMSWNVTVKGERGHTRVLLQIHLLIGVT